MHAVRSASVRSHSFQQGSFGNEDPRSYFRHSFQFLPPASVEHSFDEGPIGSSMKLRMIGSVVPIKPKLCL
jgi:hypothetical protein